MSTDEAVAGVSASWLPVPRAPAEDSLYSQVRWKNTDAIVVEVAGDIDLRTASRLEDALGEQLRARPGVLRLDLGRVGFVGAAGLRVLRRAHQVADATGVHLIVDPGGSRAAVRALDLLDRLGAGTPALR
jgi:anti-anti-sigma factor